MTNIIILSLSIVTNHAVIQYSAPVGLYQLEYNRAKPEYVAADLGVWRKSNIVFTNQSFGSNTLSFNIVDMPKTLSFRLNRIDSQKTVVD